MNSIVESLTDAVGLRVSYPHPCVIYIFNSKLVLVIVVFMCTAMFGILR